MTRLSKLEIMRRNRPKLARAQETVRQRINRIETEMTGHWHVEIDELTALAAQEQQRQRLEERVTRLEQKLMPRRRRRWWWPFRSLRFQFA